MGLAPVRFDAQCMSFDCADPPVDPPASCRHRLLWRLARALWDVHAGRCLGQTSRCQLCDLAQQGMQTACGSTAPASPPWIEVTRQRIATGEIDPADAIAEVIWLQRHRGEGG